MTAATRRLLQDITPLHIALAICLALNLGFFDLHLLTEPQTSVRWRSGASLYVVVLLGHAVALHLAEKTNGVWRLLPVQRRDMALALWGRFDGMIWLCSMLAGIGAILLSGVSWTSALIPPLLLGCGATPILGVHLCLTSLPRLLQRRMPTLTVWLTFALLLAIFLLATDAVVGHVLSIATVFTILGLAGMAGSALRYRQAQRGQSSFFKGWTIPAAPPRQPGLSLRRFLSIHLGLGLILVLSEVVFALGYDRTPSSRNLVQGFLGLNILGAFLAFGLSQRLGVLRLMPLSSRHISSLMLLLPTAFQMTLFALGIALELSLGTTRLAPTDILYESAVMMVILQASIALTVTGGGQKFVGLLFVGAVLGGSLWPPSLQDPASITGLILALLIGIWTHRRLSQGRITMVRR